MLARAVLELLELVEAESDDFPGVRAGISWGAAVSRGGDLYGRPVNLASRLTGVARPGSLLAAAEPIDPLEGAESLSLSDAGHKRLKGIDGAVHIYRVRYADLDDREPEDEPGGPEDGEQAEDTNGGDGGDAELSSAGRRSRRRRARRSEPRHP